MCSTNLYCISTLMMSTKFTVYYKRSYMKTCYMKHCLLACIIPVFLLIATTSFSNSCNEIPVIFVFQGRSWYLKHTLWQARQYNRRVILISDDPRNKYDLDIEYHDVAPYKQDVDRITAPYATLTVSRSLFLLKLCLLCSMMVPYYLCTHQ